jgi:hypothetical protein
MTTIVSLFIRSKDLASPVIAALCKEFPFGKKGVGFSVSLSPNDEQLGAILNRLDAMGIPRVNYSKKERPKDEYILEYRRTYAEDGMCFIPSHRCP